MKRRWPGLVAAFAIGLIFLPALLVLLAVTGRLPSDRLSAPPGWEAALSGQALEASLERRADGVRNPIAPGDEAALVAGMALYRNNCAGCHGGLRGPSAWGSAGFYPRVPQFWQQHHAHLTPAEARRHPLFGNGRLARDDDRAGNVDDRELRQPDTRAAAASRMRAGGPGRRPRHEGRIEMRLTYAIKYVADMDKAVAFHRDTLGLPLAFASPFWTEFATGETKLALHPATDTHPAGSVQLGFAVEDLDAFYQGREEAGLTFTMPPTPTHGSNLARFLDSEGAETTVSG